MILECLKRSNTPNIMYSCGINCDFVKKSILHSKYNLTIQTIPTILFGTLLAHSGGVGDTVPFEQNTTILQSEHNLTIQMQSSQSFLAHIWHKGGSGSWLPYSTYLYLDFHLFHDKAKRTQQGNLLISYHSWKNAWMLQTRLCNSFSFAVQIFGLCIFSFLDQNDSRKC